MVKASGATAKKRRVYIYCRTSRYHADGDEGPDARQCEVRRYTLRKELKRDVYLHPGYAVRREGRWHQVDSEPLTIYKYKLPGRIKVVLCHAPGQWERGLPRWWPEGKPDPPKPEPEPEEERFSSAWFEDLMKSRGYVKPDWAAFGFECKPSEADFKKSHRKQSRKFHPDHGGDAGEFATMQAKAEHCLTCFKKAVA